jgi:ankyrin repeat protein
MVIGNVDSAQLLLNYGVAISVYESAYMYAADSMSSQLFSAILHCDVKAFEKILLEREDLVYHRSSDGTTLLIAAAYSGCEAIVDALLTRYDVELVDEAAANGMTALMTAASRSFPNIVRLLLSKGHADANYPHKFAGTTALHMAAELGYPLVISILCEYGADPMLRTSTGGTPLHVHAAVGGKTTAETVDALIQCGADLMALLNDDTTAIYLAAQNGHADTVEALIQRGADATFAMPFTAYHGKHHLTTSASFGAFMDIGINSEAGNGAEAIHAAAEEGRVEVMRVLIKYSREQHCDGGRIKRVDLNTRSMGVSPLHSAAQYNHPEIVSMLIAAGADVNISSKTDGATPLYYAVGHGYADVVATMIQGNASLTQRQRSGGFPLLYAVIRRHKEIVRQLVEAGAPVDDATTTGLTAIHVASITGQSSVLKYLLKELRKLSHHNFSLCGLTADGDSILHVSLRAADASANENIVSLLLQHAVISASPDCDVQSFVNLRSQKDSSNGLHLAAMHASAPTLKALLDQDIDCNSLWQASEMELVSPLLLTIRRGDVDLTEVLLAHGCDIEAVNHIAISRNNQLHKTQVTALLTAIDRRDTSMVKLLLRHKVDVNHGIAGGGVLESPLLLAVVRGAADIAMALLGNGASCNLLVASSTDPNKRESLLDIARRKRDYDMIQALSSFEQCQQSIQQPEL